MLWWRRRKNRQIGKKKEVKVEEAAPEHVENSKGWCDEISVIITDRCYVLIMNMN